MFDIAPTATMYARTDKDFATRYFWWFFFIQPAPLPERLIGADPDYFLRHHIENQSKTPGSTPPDLYAEYCGATRIRPAATQSARITAPLPGSTSITMPPMRTPALRRRSLPSGARRGPWARPTTSSPRGARRRTTSPDAPLSAATPCRRNGGRGAGRVGTLPGLRVCPSVARPWQRPGRGQIDAVPRGHQTETGHRAGGVGADDRFALRGRRGGRRRRRACRSPGQRAGGCSNGPGRPPRSGGGWAHRGPPRRLRAVPEGVGSLDEVGAKGEPALHPSDHRRHGQPVPPAATGFHSSRSVLRPSAGTWRALTSWRRSARCARNQTNLTLIESDAAGAEPGEAVSRIGLADGGTVEARSSWARMEAARPCGRPAA